MLRGELEGPVLDQRGGHVRSLAAAVLILGIGAAALGAVQWRSYVSAQQSQAVASRTNVVAASVGAALQRDEDLVETLRGMITAGLTLSNRQLASLYDQVGSDGRSGLVGLAYVRALSLTQLPQAQAELRADPATLIGGVPSPSPLRGATGHDLYCVPELATIGPAARGARSGTAAALFSLLFDSGRCTTSVGRLLMSAARAGHQRVAILSVDPVDAFRPFEIVLPVYAADDLGASGARASALLGWIDGIFSPGPVVDPVVDKSVAVRVSYLQGAHRSRSLRPGPP
ncbi:MAG: hypothetical protein ACRDVP_08055 [Acidimicrobiales bacterium]